jgi:hypothetical protein
MKTEHEIRAVKWIVVPKVVPKGWMSQDEHAIKIEIDDEGAGKFVRVSSPDEPAVAIDPAEWATVRQAIDHAIDECRDGEAVGKGMSDDIQCRYEVELAQAKGIIERMRDAGEGLVEECDPTVLDKPAARDRKRAGIKASRDAIGKGAE